MRRRHPLPCRPLQSPRGGAAPWAPDGAHRAQGLDVDELAVEVEIEEPAGPVLVILPPVSVVRL
ncbi:hypothetical protein FH063_002373 [Azospirillum argentinense]|uniref:Uncharacterized protein n=1 Tax=Azospirillum argentinense TaxID=2970906 RepID=A0A5B0KPG5_9PROT|nr:hypothetical protein FH063_002373 [Azospirillum argentinense]